MPKRGSKINQKLEKRVPKFNAFFERVPKLTFHSFGGQNGGKTEAKCVQNRVRSPKRRVFANMLNLLRLLYPNEGAGVAKIKENPEKSMEKR